MATSMFFQLKVDSLHSAAAVITKPFIYILNQAYLLCAKIVGAIVIVVNCIFDVICWVIDVILTPFVLLFRLISYVCGVLFSAVSTVVHYITITTFNVLFTYENIDSDSWFDFLQNLRPTFYLVLLLVALLLWQHYTSRKKLENVKRNFCSRLEDSRKRFNSSVNISNVVDFVLQEAALHIEETQPLPDVETKVNLPLTVCRVTAVEGVAEGVNALCAGRPATARREGSHLVLDVAAGLRQLRVRYRRYTALAPFQLLPPFYVSGEATITVSPVILRVVLVLQSPFRVRLRSVEVSELGLPDVDLTGLGDWNFLWRLTNWLVMGRVRREMRKQIELQARPIVEDVLLRVNRTTADIPIFKVLLSDDSRGKELALAPREVLTPGYLGAIAAVIAAGFLAACGHSSR